VFFVEFTTTDRYTCVDYFTLAKLEMYLLAVDSWNQSLYQAASIFRIIWADYEWQKY
jgi:hypothetical protein